MSDRVVCSGDIRSTRIGLPMCPWQYFLINSDKRFKHSLLDHLFGLIEQSSLPNYFSGAAASGRLFQTLGFDENCIPEKQRPAKFPVANGGKSQGINVGKMAAESGNPGKAQQAMGDGLAIMAFRREFVIHMQGIQVACHRRKLNYVRLGNRTTWAHPDVPDENVIERERRIHSFPSNFDN